MASNIFMEDVAQPPTDTEHTAAVQEAVRHYENKMKENVVFPTKTLDQFLELSRRYEIEALRKFLRRSIQDEEQKFLQKFLELIDEKRKEFHHMNEEKSREVCEAPIKKLSGDYEEALSKGSYTICGGHERFRRNLKEIEDKYHLEPGKGLQAETVLKEYTVSQGSIGNTILKSNDALEEKEMEIEGPDIFPVTTCITEEDADPYSQERGGVCANSPTLLGDKRSPSIMGMMKTIARAFFPVVLRLGFAMFQIKAQQKWKNDKIRFDVETIFHCQETGIKFVGPSTTTIECSLEYGDDYMKLIQKNGYKLLGPTLNVRVLSGRVSAIYPPHYARLQGYRGEKMMIKSGHKDGKVTLKFPSRIEASRVVLGNPTFSCVAAVGTNVTSVSRRKKPCPSHGKVLIYFRLVCEEDKEVMEYRIHLYLIPSGRPYVQKLTELKRLDGFKRIDKPHRTSTVYTETNYIISAEPDPKIQPRTLPFIDHKEIESYPFTEINVSKTAEKISLRVEEEKSSESETVWSGELTRADIKELSRQAARRGVPPEHFIDQHRCDLVQKVKNIQPVLDNLQKQKLLTEEECSTVRSQSTPQDKMRTLLMYVIHWGNEDKDTFYRVIKSHNRSCIKKIGK
ncbi:NACHT, LRR and PYD domains-containing protein 1a allele 5-like isoform X2 [Dendropsophus ebraccatus]|uniref:NACHT, LRR and PYD domains-containing protein 1a allele 5-like isoform X2 n=1 Tax=Dendropsophus ebraccatus TaxID=150705 RepID=UPI0038318602